MHHQLPHMPNWSSPSLSPNRMLTPLVHSAAAALPAYVSTRSSSAADLLGTDLGLCDWHSLDTSRDTDTWNLAGQSLGLCLSRSNGLVVDRRLGLLCCDFRFGDLGGGVDDWLGSRNDISAPGGLCLYHGIGSLIDGSGSVDRRLRNGCNLGGIDVRCVSLGNVNSLRLESGGR